MVISWNKFHKYDHSWKVHICILIVILIHNIKKFFVFLEYVFIRSLITILFNKNELDSLYFKIRWMHRDIDIYRTNNKYNDHIKFFYNLILVIIRDMNSKKKSKKIIITTATKYSNMVVSTSELDEILVATILNKNIPINLDKEYIFQEIAGIYNGLCGYPDIGIKNNLGKYKLIAQVFRGYSKKHLLEMIIEKLYKTHIFLNHVANNNLNIDFDTFYLSAIVTENVYLRTRKKVKKINHALNKKSKIKIRISLIILPKYIHKKIIRNVDKLYLKRKKKIESVDEIISKLNKIIN